MLEQFIIGLPDDLRIWLRERKPTSLCQAATLADDYALARMKSGNKITYTNATCLQESTAVSDQEQSPRDRPLNNLTRPGRSQTNTRGDKKCFQCGKFGHLMYSCPVRQVPVTKPAFKWHKLPGGCLEQGEPKVLASGYPEWPGSSNAD